MAETTIKFGNYIYEYGYVMISNLLVDYQNELDLTNDEVMFIIKVYRHKNGYKLHDMKLDQTLSTKTLQRRRKSLSDKGYLDYRVIKSTDNSGNIITEGIVYDFTKLDITLCQLANRLTEEAKPEQQKEEEQIEKNKKLLEARSKKESAIENFKEEFKLHFNKEYQSSNEEKEIIKRLSLEEVEALKYVFEYCEENKDNLPEDFVPRITFFTKVEWRMKQLIDFSKECEERTKGLLEEKELEERNKKAEEKWWALVGTEEEDNRFTLYLRKNKPSVFVKKRNGMMVNIIDELEVVYKEYKEQNNDIKAK